MYVVLHEVTCHGVWLYGMHRMCWDSSSFTWHQPCNNKTVLLVHHFSGGEEGAVAAWRDSDSQPHAKESSAFTTSPHRLKLWGPQDTHTHTHKPYPLQNNLMATSRRKKLMMQCETISRALLAETQLDMDKSTTTKARSTMMSSTVNKRNRMCSTTRWMLKRSDLYTTQTLASSMKQQRELITTQKKLGDGSW